MSANIFAWGELLTKGRGEGTLLYYLFHILCKKKKVLHYCIDQYLRLLKLLQDCAVADLSIWGFQRYSLNNWDLEGLISFFEIFIFTLVFCSRFWAVILKTNREPITKRRKKKLIKRRKPKKTSLLMGKKLFLFFSFLFFCREEGY